MTASEYMQLAFEYRRRNLFGDAVNAFMAVENAADATPEDKTMARVNIELIQEINGFVNVDLMNP